MGFWVTVKGNIVERTDKKWRWEAEAEGVDLFVNGVRIGTIWDGVVRNVKRVDTVLYAGKKYLQLVVKLEE